MADKKAGTVAVRLTGRWRCRLLLWLQRLALPVSPRLSWRLLRLALMQLHLVCGRRRERIFTPPAPPPWSGGGGSCGKARGLTVTNTTPEAIPAGMLVVIKRRRRSIVRALCGKAPAPPWMLN